MTPVTSASLFTEITIPGLSLPLVALLLLIILPCGLLAGHRVGRAKRRHLHEQGAEIDKVVGETTMNAFLALLGLLLAFTFGNSLSVSQSIKSAITDEAAAIGTAFLRMDYVPEPGRTAAQTAILDYARTRLVPANISMTQEDARGFLEATMASQAKIWPLTLQATAEASDPIKTFVAGAVNEMLDAHLYRMATLSLPISAFTQWMALLAGLMAVFLVANRAGMLGHALTWRVYVFALFLCAVMYTIVDIRRSREGLILVDDSALRATIFDMEQALAAR